MKQIRNTHKKRRIFSTHTCALLSIGEVWWNGDGSSLTSANSNETLVHAGDDVPSTHIRVIGVITGITGKQIMPPL